MLNVYSNIFPASSGGVWKSRDWPEPAIGLPSIDSSVSWCGTLMVRRVRTSTPTRWETRGGDPGWDGAFVAGAWARTIPPAAAPCRPATIDNATIKRRMTSSPGKRLPAIEGTAGIYGTGGVPSRHDADSVMLPIRDADRVSFAFGDFDIAGILELLGNVDAAAFAIAAAGGGAIKAIKTTPLMTWPRASRR
jgi:hypothetical protein